MSDDVRCPECGSLPHCPTCDKSDYVRDTESRERLIGKLFVRVRELEDSLMCARASAKTSRDDGIEYMRSSNAWKALARQYLMERNDTVRLLDEVAGYVEHNPGCTDRCGVSACDCGLDEINERFAGKGIL